MEMKKRTIISFVIFAVGALMLCAAGRNLTLNWTETAFVIGAILATAASMILAGEIKWFEEE